MKLKERRNEIDQEDEIDIENKVGEMSQTRIRYSECDVKNVM